MASNAVRASAREAVDDFERERQERILANRRRMEELAVHSAVQQLAVAGQETFPAQRQRRSNPRDDRKSSETAELRRSTRENKSTVSYKEEDWFSDLPRLGGSGPRGPRREVDEEEVEALRKAHGVADVIDDGEASQPDGAGRGRIDSGKGVRLQGGRVYDSKYGVTCHWCRQKTLEEHVTCTNPACGKGKRLPTSFCKMCLRNRHGEDCVAAAASNAWQCPQCRGSCGRGCVACCNCGPCRKKLSLEPTHQVVKLAKDAGFGNVHDYLVHLVTGETPDELRARKLRFPWGQWLKPGQAGSARGSESCDQDDTTGVAPRHASEPGDAMATVTAAASASLNYSRPGVAVVHGNQAKAKAGKKGSAATGPLFASAGSDEGEVAAAAAQQGRGKRMRGSSRTAQRDRQLEDQRAGPGDEGVASPTLAPPASSALDDPALRSVALTKKQRRQLEMGIISLQDLLGKLEASTSAVAASPAKSIPVSVA